MKKIENWDSIEAVEYGEYEVLELGGHRVKIVNAYEYTSEITGNTSLKIMVDISGNDKQAGFFKKQYDSNTNENKKWSNGACRYLSLKDENLGMLKGFITCVENSNKGYKWNWDESTLIGKELCGVFGLEEYVDNEGNKRTATKLTQFRSLDKLAETKIPKVKLLNGSYVDYELYQQQRTNGVEYSGDNLDSLFNTIPDEKLPF